MWSRSTRVWGYGSSVFTKAGRLSANKPWTKVTFVQSGGSGGGALLVRAKVPFAWFDQAEGSPSKLSKPITVLSDHPGCFAGHTCNHSDVLPCCYPELEPEAGSAALDSGSVDYMLQRLHGEHELRH